ncbi:predicted protein [Histoplasma capsulatum var. duboisii H88]|uniref:Predicted protein n=2 Tax=Ajellomyces capsulatus TaxID=5037 RepID=F0U5N3_AJEC8|nr:predicted protein [Histoplasma capsulatum H143]EGC42170.1 predicted protein [Histoplasma capsulatum var. duboisii H88]
MVEHHQTPGLFAQTIRHIDLPISYADLQGSQCRSPIPEFRVLSDVFLCMAPSGLGVRLSGGKEEAGRESDSIEKKQKTRNTLCLRRVVRCFWQPNITPAGPTPQKLQQALSLPYKIATIARYQANQMRFRLALAATAATEQTQDQWFSKGPDVMLQWKQHRLVAVLFCNMFSMSLSVQD